METYGICNDPLCDYADIDENEADLLDGVCYACWEAYWEAEEFAKANNFDMYEDDFGQVPYGIGYN